MSFWPAIVFGWPSAFIGLALLVVGIVVRKTWVVGLGALVAAGFCVYLAMNPMPFRLLGLFAIASNGCAAIAVQRRRLLLASTCLLPFLAVSAYLVVAVRNLG